MEEGGKGEWREGGKGRGEREEWRGRERGDPYSFLIDTDWLLSMHIQYFVNALWILESDESKTPAIKEE